MDIDEWCIFFMARNYVILLDVFLYNVYMGVDP